MAQQYDHPFLPGVKFEIPADFPHAIQYDSNGFPFYTFGSDQAIPAIPEFTNPLGQGEFQSLLSAASAQGPQAVLDLFQNPRVPGLFRQLAKDPSFFSEISRDPSFAGNFFGGSATPPGGGGTPVDGLGGSFGFTSGSSGGSSFGIPLTTYYSTPSFGGGGTLGLPQGGTSGSGGTYYPGTGGSSGGLGTLGTLLAGGAAIGGLASLFGDNETTVRSQQAPLSAAELQLLGINTQLALSQLSAYQGQLGAQGQQNSLLSQLFEQELGGYAPTQEQVRQYGADCEGKYSNDPNAKAICNEMYRQQITKNNVEARQQRVRTEETTRDARLGGLNATSDQLGQLALSDAQQGTQALRPDQLERLRGSADLTIQTGLSDLSRFRDESLNSIQLNSVGRGLRPGDTPIQNDFHDVGIESGRLAQNFVNSVRGQQMNAELNLPFQEAGIRNQSLGLASDLNFKRQALEESLRQQATQNRLGLASGVQSTGLGLATGLNPTSAFGALTGARAATGTQTTQQSGLSQLAPLLGGIGGLLTGLNNTGIFGNQNQGQSGRLF